MFRQAVCHWCFKGLSLDALCRLAAPLGVVGVDLVGPEAVSTLRAHGLIPTLFPSHAIQRGLNDPAHHAECLAALRAAIDGAADVGCPNVVAFAGNRSAVLSDEDGLRNTVAALKEIAPCAEARGVTVCLELLNSVRDHPGYMADTTAWAARAVDAVGSPRVKILFDIYHAHTQGEDVAAMIRLHHERIGHYHTAGSPGRHELIAPGQQIDYPAVARVIAATGFSGVVAHEFLPTTDPAAALAAAVAALAV